MERAEVKTKKSKGDRPVSEERRRLEVPTVPEDVRSQALEDAEKEVRNRWGMEEPSADLEEETDSYADSDTESETKRGSELNVDDIYQAVRMSLLGHDVFMRSDLIGYTVMLGPTVSQVSAQDTKP